MKLLCLMSFALFASLSACAAAEKPRVPASGGQVGDRTGDAISLGEEVEILEVEKVEIVEQKDSKARALIHLIVSDSSCHTTGYIGKTEFPAQKPGPPKKFLKEYSLNLTVYNLNQAFTDVDACASAIREEKTQIPIQLTGSAGHPDQSLYQKNIFNVNIKTSRFGSGSKLKVIKFTYDWQKGWSVQQ